MKTRKLVKAVVIAAVVSGTLALVARRAGISCPCDHAAAAGCCPSCGNAPAEGCCSACGHEIESEPQVSQ